MGDSLPKQIIQQKHGGFRIYSWFFLIHETIVDNFEDIDLFAETHCINVNVSVIALIKLLLLY